MLLSEGSFETEKIIFQEKNFEHRKIILSIIYVVELKLFN